MLELAIIWDLSITQVMPEIQPDPEVVESINGLLDEIELRPSRNQLVVVGGSALAAWGIKPLADTDLDIVVTDSLRRELKPKPNWYEAEFTPRQLDYFPPIANGVTAIMPPFGKQYDVGAEELVAEGISCGEAGYLYSPLHRILEVKNALASLPVDQGSRIQVERQRKHWRDVMLITKYIFDNFIGPE